MPLPTRQDSERGGEPTALLRQKAALVADVKSVFDQKSETEFGYSMKEKRATLGIPTRPAV